MTQKVKKITKYAIEKEHITEFEINLRLYIFYEVIIMFRLLVIISSLVPKILLACKYYYFFLSIYSIINDFTT